MANLQDYLGTLVASVNQARVLADIESANIAEHYAQHRLLKHFSIPRMKMQNVEFTIPVAIEQVETSEPRDYQPIDNKTFVSQAYDELTNAYQVKSFDRTSSLRLRKALYRHADELEKTLKAGESMEVALQAFSDRIAAEAFEIKKPDAQTPSALTSGITAIKSKELKGDKGERIEKTVPLTKDILKHKMITRLQPEIKTKEVQRNIENANVIVEANRLKEQKSENMVFIKMTVVEEGMEWHTIENENGESKSKLLPE